jgi:hypothetical protein
MTVETNERREVLQLWRKDRLQARAPVGVQPRLCAGLLTRTPEPTEGLQNMEKLGNARGDLRSGDVSRSGDHDTTPSLFNAKLASRFRETKLKTPGIQENLLPTSNHAA